MLLRFAQRKAKMREAWVAGWALVFACIVAAIAVVDRGSSGLPDLLLEVPLGGEMKINTADGPMLVNVGNHMQCQQCSASFGTHGLSQLASCPCSVAVTGSKDGQYYEGVIKVSRLDKVDDDSGVKEDGDSEEGSENDGDGDGGDSNDGDRGCRTKPLHLRVTARGSFLDNVPVFPGDAKTEAMLEQLFHFFGPDKAGLVMDGTLTCTQQWDLEHPDYMIPKPGYPSDVAVKIPHGSTLEPLKDEELSPFKTMIPQVLRQKYGEGRDSRTLRQGLVGAMQSRLFQRDAALLRKRQAQQRGRAGALETSSDADFATPRRRVGRGGSSMKAMLRELSEKVSDIAASQQRMDGTLGRVKRVMRFGQH